MHTIGLLLPRMKMHQCLLGFIRVKVCGVL